MKIIIRNADKTFKIPIPYKLITSRTLHKFINKQNKIFEKHKEFESDPNSQDPINKNQNTETKKGFSFKLEIGKNRRDGSQRDFDLSDLTDDQLEEMVTRLKRMRIDYPGLPIFEAISADGSGITIMP